MANFINFEHQAFGLELCQESWPWIYVDGKVPTPQYCTVIDYRFTRGLFKEGISDNFKSTCELAGKLFFLIKDSAPHLNLKIKRSFVLYSCHDSMIFLYGLILQGRVSIFFFGSCRCRPFLILAETIVVLFMLQRLYRGQVVSEFNTPFLLKRLIF